MKKITKRNTAEAALLAGMIFSVFAEGVCAFSDSRKGVENDVFRLHVIAASDSYEDQKLKLLVRNAVLEKGAGIFEGKASAAEAAAAAGENLYMLQSAAEEALRENGCFEPVSCSIAKTVFDERTYGSATLPAGEYTALQVVIGEGEGHNWWCVMFPPLCLPAVTNTDEILKNAEADGVLTAEEIELIKSPENYEVRFYFAELWEKLVNYLKSRMII